MPQVGSLPVAVIEWPANLWWEVEAVPAGDLRRKDREMSREDTAALLERAVVCRVASVSLDGAPYVVPLHFAFEATRNAIFLHCATTGHLLENIAGERRVCVEVDEPGEFIVTGDTACGTSQAYSSAICFGRARVLSDGIEKRHALEAVVQKYVDRMSPERKYSPEMPTIGDTAVIMVEVERMTGKRREKP